MKFMTIPDDFKWIDMDLSELNKLTAEEKKAVLKKEEINIRQSIGEAVPTNIFRQIAEKIKDNLTDENYMDLKQITKIIKTFELNKITKLKKYISESEYPYTILSQIAELANSKRTENSAYYI